MSVDWDLAAVDIIAAFGEAITYTPNGSTSPISLNAVVDAPFVEIDALAGPPVAAQRPFVTLRLADLGITPNQQDQLVARSITYVVREVRFDGQGMARLLLTAN